MPHSFTKISKPISNNSFESKRLKICFVSDFFYPNFGGVETHIFYLAQHLIKMGHKVIIITGNVYKNRQGVRYMTNGLKIYYCSFKPLYTSQITGMLFFGSFPTVRNILIRECIQIVHGHQYSSVLAQECILIAKIMGLKTVLTNHSLFGNNVIGSIALNKLAKLIFNNLDHLISVSNTCKENLIANMFYSPEKISVIPNAIDSENFTPDPSKAPDIKKEIHIIIICRLVYRKGIDMVLDVIPEICTQFKNVKFIIVGDGPKRHLIEEMRKRNSLHNRIELHSGVPHSQVRDHLVRAHIFLNSSLTESFCMAILEAVSCGLHVVTTNVGGIPEILPSGMCTLCEPTTEDMVKALLSAINNLELTPWKSHSRVKDMYNWSQVAKKTKTVYEKVLSEHPAFFGERLKNVLKENNFSAFLFSAVMIVYEILYVILKVIFPENSTEKAVDFAL